MLASGSGTNLQALLDAYPENLVVVAGDNKEAFAFERARRAGVPVEHVDPAGFVSKEDYDRELASRIEVHDVGLVVGAGYMRILSPVFLERFPAVLNVHPSLLPEFRGLRAVERALEAGVDETGVTVHFMVEEVDAGPDRCAGEGADPARGYERYVARATACSGAQAPRPGGRRLFPWEGERMKRRALISVSDKRGIEDFARRLSAMGFEIISTGGTARALSEAGVKVVPVSEVTGAPEILGGRVKTLHPRIHGGILADLGDPDHVEQLVEQGIGPIDLVCINLYPFEETVAGGSPEKEAIEQIDVGGPAMLRAAAKNYKSVTVIPSPEFYEEILTTLESEGEVPEEARRRLALSAFRRTAEYDAEISGWLEDQGRRRHRIFRQWGRGLSRDPYGSVRTGLRAALWGESAPGCGLLCGGGCRASAEWRGEVAGA